MRSPFDHPGAANGISAFAILAMLTAMSTHAQQSPVRVAFFSSVQPENPTEADSVSIVSSGYYLRGSAVTDSTFSLSGKRYLIGFTAVADTLQTELRVNSTRPLGTLAAGTYRIVTFAQHIDTAIGGLPDTSRYVDTTTFTVFPAGSTPPRVVGTTVAYGSTVGSDTLSYYYWNGDTLSIGAAFIRADMPGNYTARVGWSGDTLGVTLIDTTLRHHRMPAGYIVVSSFAPIKRGKFPVRISCERRSVKNPYKMPVFHELSVDNTQEALALSIKTPGAAEFTLFPVDSEINGFTYYLSSPFIDTVKVVGLQPNPACIVPKHSAFFVGDLLLDGYEPLEDWESYRARVWNFVKAHPGDQVTLDTVNVDGDHWLAFSYSTTANKAVESYVYRNLDSAVVSERNSITLTASWISPQISSARQNSLVTNRTARNPWMKISTLHTFVQMTVVLPGTVSPNALRFEVVNVCGRTVRVLQSTGGASESGQLTVQWDRRDSRGDRVAPGVYSVRLAGLSAPGRGATIAIR